MPPHEVNFRRSATRMSRVAAILPAAGLGTRMGAETPKQFLDLDGVPIVLYTLRRIASCPLITAIYIATRSDEVPRLEERIRGEKFAQAVRVLRGGDSRQASVAQALREVIEQKPNKCVINGKTFLQFEDWQTLGRFYGVTAAARTTNYIEQGRVRGYECHAEAIRADGQVISAANPKPRQCATSKRSDRVRPELVCRS